ncbi:GNAT family N-acetyltransferase [Cereibacter changlensis JA139]|uniref:GNAT family N-acetyltransferase n=2 Tax=Cereibacter changlensis TaxID=402884 RepID=A0A2T4JKT4_9RHOB|nr:GNAT family N-acetyltransferase [Cereibacter changlensis]PTE18488.1 GNAT family N-acetyltransferase [Cereibacter changlensis JA139]PZX51132.1 ribosomal protein S18 acetylase RimI-like enzyme [Cereibacter changlensis]
MTGISIRPLTLHDRGAWEVLWRENLAHFAAGDVASETMPVLWDRLMAEGEPLQGWLILRQGVPAGFAHVVLRLHSFSARPVGILEDLWVSAPARRQGLAEACLAHLQREGRAQGWIRLEWETDADNLAAQALYDRLAAAAPVKRYRIDLL